jgi:hypothetical protein
MGVLSAGLLIAAKVRSNHVPVKVFCFVIQRKKVG